MLFLRSARRGAFVAVASSICLSGCINDTYIPPDRTDRSPRELTVTHRAGGTHHRGMLHDGTWYVTQGATLLAIDPRSGRVRGEEAVVPAGASGAIVDLVVWHEDLIVVLDETAIARIDIRSGRSPITVEIIDAATLGIEPRTLSVQGDALYVSGTGGVVRLPDMRRFLQGEGTVGPVVKTERGMAAPTDRRIVTLEGGEFLGAATELVELPASIGVPGGFAFALQSREGGSVGLMGADLRELASDVVAGWIRRLRVLDGRLWVVTDSELITWDISKGALASRENFALKGGCDIDAINDNYFAVVGSFGRAVFRMHDDTTGNGDDFLRITRVPGRIDLAISDQRTWIASSVEGTWRYQLRGKPELVDRKVEVWGVPLKEASGSWGTARLVGSDGEFTRVEISTGVGGTKGEWTPPLDGRVWSLVVIDGDLWVGHDRGIAVLRRQGSADEMSGVFPVKSVPPRGKASPGCPLVEIGSIVCEGPVFNLSPLRTGQGASFVSRWGGFGVVEWVIPSSKPKPIARPSGGAGSDSDGVPRSRSDDR